MMLVGHGGFAKVHCGIMTCGIVKVNRVSLGTVAVAASIGTTPGPKLTNAAPERPVPITVTRVPIGPDDGEMLVMRGVAVWAEATGINPKNKPATNAGSSAT